MLSDQFRARVREIDIYYDFLDKVTSSKAVLSTNSRSGAKIKGAIDTDLVKILKANAFLLLYNLVESSVREGITYIYDSLQNDGLTYKDLREELRQIWVNDEVNPEVRRLPEGMARIVKDLVESVIADQLVTFNPETIPIAGNLDARKVRELATKYGFAHTTHQRTRGGEVLLRVKTERNNLAHGLTSFVECGRDITYPTLKSTKSRLVLYISNILANIESYVAAKAYRK